MPRLCLTWPLFIVPVHCWPDILLLCYPVINPLWRINEKCNQFACCFELAATEGTGSFGGIVRPFGPEKRFSFTDFNWLMPVVTSTKSLLIQPHCPSWKKFLLQCYLGFRGCFPRSSCSPYLPLLTFSMSHSSFPILSFSIKRVKRHPVDREHTHMHANNVNRHTVEVPQAAGVLSRNC